MEEDKPQGSLKLVQVTDLERQRSRSARKAKANADNEQDIVVYQETFEIVFVEDS